MVDPWWTSSSLPKTRRPGQRCDENRISGQDLEGGGGGKHRSGPDLDGGGGKKHRSGPDLANLDDGGGRNRKSRL